jgi:hypothetical protein
MGRHGTHDSCDNRAGRYQLPRPLHPCYWDQASSEWEGAGHPLPGLLGLAVACRSCGRIPHQLQAGHRHRSAPPAFLRRPRRQQAHRLRAQADDLGPPIRTATVQDHYLYARDGGADLELTRRPARSGQRSPGPRKAVGITGPSAHDCPRGRRVKRPRRVGARRRTHWAVVPRDCLPSVMRRWFGDVTVPLVCRGRLLVHPRAACRSGQRVISMTGFRATAATLGV